MSIEGNATAKKIRGKINHRYKLSGKINRLYELRGYSAYEVAVLNGFEGTEEEWLESLNGEPGDVPYIGDNGNWWVGGTDTGVSAGGAGDGVVGSVAALKITHDGQGNVKLENVPTTDDDRIVEQGVKDKWIYRKWASGVAECWRSVTATVKTTDWKDSGMMSFLSYGLFWTRDVKIQLNYPFAFASRPAETACMTNGTVWFPLSLISTTGKQLDRTDSYRICTYKIPEQNIEVTISFHVVGMWK